MVRNHIFLMMDYINKLMDLAMVQRWIDLSRKEHSDNQEVQLVLDREQARIVKEKIKLQDEMFEISRSN